MTTLDAADREALIALWATVFAETLREAVDPERADDEHDDAVKDTTEAA